MKNATKMLVTLCVAVLLVAATAQAATVDVDTNADSWTRGNSQDANYGNHVNISPHYRSDGFIAKGYMRFDISGLAQAVDSATLSLVFAGSSNTEGDETFDIDVYGLNNGTTGETTWTEGDGTAGSGITWNNAPGEPDNSPADNAFENATLLGTITVDVSDGVGTTYTLSSAALVTFLNAGGLTDDEVTIMLTAQDLDTNSEGIGFASKEHATLAAPELSMTEVPEPATMSLLGIGGLLALVRRRRK